MTALQSRRGGEAGSVAVAAACAAAGLLLLVAILGGSVAAVTDWQAAACTQPRPGPAARTIPPAYLTWYQQAGAAYGVPWAVLAGIGETESDHGRSNAPGVHSGHNPAGAEGPMQFEPATFAMYAAGPHLPRTPYDPADAIFTAAHMLAHDGAASGTPAGLRAAIYAYNHAGWYVTKVLRWASRYAAGHVSLAGSRHCQQLALGPLPPGAAGKVLRYAEAQIGKPYRWGGTGPGSFDCSGLAMMAYRAAGITIPRTSQLQFAFGRRIPASQVRPGDLVFFAGADGTLAAPGHVGIVVDPARHLMIDAYATGFPVTAEVYGVPGARGGLTVVAGFTRPL